MLLFQPVIAVLIEYVADALSAEYHLTPLQQSHV